MPRSVTSIVSSSSDVVVIRDFSSVTSQTFCTLSTLRSRAIHQTVTRHTIVQATVTAEIITQEVSHDTIHQYTYSGCADEQPVCSAATETPPSPPPVLIYSPKSDTNTLRNIRSLRSGVVHSKVPGRFIGRSPSGLVAQKLRRQRQILPVSQPIQPDVMPYQPVSPRRSARISNTVG